MNRLYKMHEMLKEPDKMPKNLDYYLYAANTNIRCYDSFCKLAEVSCSMESIILFDYKKLRPITTDELLENYHEYKKHHPTQIVECNNDDDDVRYVAKMKIQESDIVGIDITGFTVPDLFRIMYLLKEIKKVKVIHVFYTEPQYYLFKDDIFNTYELLSGERTYQSIPEYFTFGKTEKELLVCFLGFDLSVSDYIYEKALPSEAVAVNGFPSYLPKLKDISLLNNFSILTDNVDNEHRFFTRANNPFSAYNTLCDIQKKFPDYLMNICVLGTKPMALGACLFSLDNKENVKVTYPYPERYVPKTSESSTSVWYYMVGF